MDVGRHEHEAVVACFSQTKFVSKCPIVWHMSYFSYSAHSVENISDNKSFINANDKYKVVIQSM